VQHVHHLAADMADIEAQMMDALDHAILRRLQQDGQQLSSLTSSMMLIKLAS
jgi:membrane protease subunit (stomatin/prohibitin family)